MNSDSTVKGVLIFLGLVVTLFILKTCSAILIPLAIACFLFVLVNPLMDKMEKVRIPQVLAALLLVLLVAAVCFFFVYVMIAMVNTLLVKLPEYVYKVSTFDAFVSAKIRQGFSMEYEEFPSILSTLNIDWFGQVRNMLTSISSLSAYVLGKVAMIILYLMFLLLERATILLKIDAAFPRKKGRYPLMVANIGRQTSRYFSIKVLISLSTGILFYLVALFGGMDFALVWGVMAFLLNFIPTIGSILITISASLLAAIQFMPDWGHFLLLSVLFLLIEVILGNILDPKISGVQLDLSPLVILVMLAVWGYLWGIIGMFLAVPITSIVQVICASVDNLKPVAILLSSGTIYLKDEKEDKKAAQE